MFCGREGYHEISWGGLGCESITKAPGGGLNITEKGAARKAGERRRRLRSSMKREQEEEERGGGDNDLRFPSQDASKE